MTGGAAAGSPAWQAGRVASFRDRALRRLPRWLVEEAPRDHPESDAQLRRRRRAVAATLAVGGGLLGASLASKPGSSRFYALTGATALTWIAGGLAAGPLHLGRAPGRGATRRPLGTPVLLGVGAFGLFYGCALVARRIPVLDRAIASVLQYADRGSAPLVYASTLVSGVGEEVFFRGALYDAVPRRPVATSTAVYVLATTATRNPALVLASGVMGTLFGLERRASGGILAPLLTHLTWSALMLRFLPPLFRRPRDAAHAPRKARSPSRSRSTSASST